MTNLKSGANAAFLLCLLCLLPLGASARVFDVGKEKFGTYLKGSYSTAPVGQSMFEKSSGTGMTFDNEVKYLPGYEFGFLWSMPWFNMRFGFELITPSKLKDVEARDASDNLIYNLTSDFSVATPKIGLEVNVNRWKESRTFVGGDWGMANLTVTNSYTFQSGQTKFPSLTDFREETKSAAQTYSGFVGFETLFFDTTTFVIEAGYRVLKFDTLKHNTDITNFQGTVVKGDQAHYDDGTARSVDLSGPFASVQFRFWMY